MARPRRVLLFPKAIYADLMLTSSGTRGRILEELVLKLTTPDGSFQLREWVHTRKGDKQYLQRTSAFIPYTGYVASHEWYFDKDETFRVYTSGPQKIEIFDVGTTSFIRPNGRRLFSVEFYLAAADIESVNSQGPYSDDHTPGFVELDWNFLERKYQISYRPTRKIEDDES